MEGLVYIEQDLDGRPCDIWVQKHFQSFPFVGIKWFDIQHPLVSSKNLIDKINARDLGCDWICSGDITIHVPRDARLQQKSHCKLKIGNDTSSIRLNLLHEQKNLYVFQFYVKSSLNPASSLCVTMGCEDEYDGQRWLKEMRDIELQQNYIQSTTTNNQDAKEKL